MVHTFQQDGKKTASINVFIDPQCGFSSASLKSQQGGSLYVPGGEEVPAEMGKIIAGTRNGIFIIGQDYHPKEHISFLPNHTGVWDYRIEKYKKLLTDHNQSIPSAEELKEQAQQPVHFFDGYDKPPVSFPFEEMVTDVDGQIIGIKEADGRIRKVEVKTENGKAPSEKDRGRISKVMDDYFDKTFDEMRAEGTIVHTQTLWTRHCEQGEQSSLYPESMNLPKGLRDKLVGNLKADIVSYHDPETGNQFHVIRKGTHSEIDSYGIGVENDGKTLTPAWGLFSEISNDFARQGIEKTIFNVGGLATNFCTEFSVNNIADFLAGHFKMKNMETAINFVPEISRAIPIAGGPDVPFSADGANERMRRSRGVGQISVADIIAAGKPGHEIQGDLSVSTGQQKAL